ncbi:AT-hook motif nuclear-localized protein 5-like [Rutidosis leptorrhynchoides]|uniref:AT-hook motif nuclear-localized protein 5-like n=1 Tax=Rutidosis leptorrhynchoides TaxID=125765 RepID=UPI003A994461
MDGREGLSSFYLNRNGSGNQSGGLQSHAPPPAFKTQSNPNLSQIYTTFSLEDNSSPSFTLKSGNVGDPVVKKKRGRPRKYAPNESHMAFGLTPGSLSGAVSPNPERKRGRPPGSGRKQRLANVGEWMSNSAGSAFNTHTIHVSAGEDVAEKIYLFSQRKPRALCVLSGTGSVSVVTLSQHTSSRPVTYEGRFEILCLSGCYLVPENGSTKNRIGGLSISVCCGDGSVIGGAIGGRLVASNSVQVVVCSFVHGGDNNVKGRTQNEAPSTDNDNLGIELNDICPVVAVPWEVDSRDGLRNSPTEIDLSRG